MYRVILHAMCPIHDAQLILVCKVARDVSGDIACDVPDTWRATILVCKVARDVSGDIACDVPDTWRATIILVCKVARDVSGDITCNVPDTLRIGWRPIHCKKWNTYNICVPPIITDSYNHRLVTTCNLIHVPPDTHFAQYMFHSPHSLHSLHSLHNSTTTARLLQRIIINKIIHRW